MNVENACVKMWEQDIEIPTYPVGTPDKNPMFLEKRVYQGSSGRVYPHSVIDKIGDTKGAKRYHAVFLENEYLRIMVLPELGGRIQRATDKTNGYDFVYYNHVIKPALVGLCGPWISGGIEFNWPQHHRPSTFDPVDFKLERGEDGSCTVYVSEVENMFRTKGMAAITLRPGKAYIEISAQLYNRTSVPQTFLWWANPAIPVNDYTQSIFPPDVTAVMDHGKRDVSSFPIATGTYYKQDYSAGVDISRYKNIPVPTSYMAYHSDYNFVGGYDYDRQAGILHVADHHVSPGKKQWTWGCGEFGKAWDRNLTDEDGPYIELMTGVFTDNQPDFTWMAPYEEKVFTQYFMPYKTVGRIKNATVEAAVGVEVEDGVLLARAYATSRYPHARIVVTARGAVLLDREQTLSPTDTLDAAMEAPEGLEAWEVGMTVYDAHGKALVSYVGKAPEPAVLPEPAQAAPLPEEAETCEDLFLYGQHIEQYRHATYEAGDYYREGLRRDPTDARLNNGYGSLLLRRGLFKESEKYFCEAVKKLTRSNPNPYDGEPLYNLGLSLRYQGKLEQAYDAFYKATWSGAWQDSAFYQLASIACAAGEEQVALEHVERSIVRNVHNLKARNLKTALLRRLGQYGEARRYAMESLSIDPLDFGSRFELLQLAHIEEDVEGEALAAAELAALLHGNHNTYIEQSLDYTEAGLYREAIEFLDLYLTQTDASRAYPMALYHKAYNLAQQGRREEALSCVKQAEAAPSDYCFPHRLEDILALEYALRVHPHGARAAYYLGDLWYDKRQYDRAVAAWEQSCKLDNKFPTVHRNLALAYYNKRGDGAAARAQMEAAYALDPTDARVLMELDQLYQKLGVPNTERLTTLQGRLVQVMDRDDLYLEYVALHNYFGRYEEALRLLSQRRFHPWEGGEGKVPAQYLLSHVQLAKQALANGNPKAALPHLLTAAGPYPENLGEGKLAGAQENHIYYYMGVALSALGDEEGAAKAFRKAAQGLSEPAGMMYYNDQPPEMIYYQGLALRALGEEEAARSRFHKLIAYGQAHLDDEVRIDYFAVSLPDLLIFDDDLGRRNQVHCHFMMALGYQGQGEAAEAAKHFDAVRALAPNHLGAQTMQEK